MNTKLWGESKTLKYFTLRQIAPPLVGVGVMVGAEVAAAVALCNVTYNNYHLMNARKASRCDYLKQRTNGLGTDDPRELDRSGPARPFPWDGKYTTEILQGKWKKIRYDEGPGDKKWMEEKDRNYVKRLIREGRLDEEEPNLETEVPKLYAELEADILALRKAKAPEAEKQGKAEQERREHLLEVARAREELRKKQEKLKKQEEEYKQLELEEEIARRKATLAGSQESPRKRSSDSSSSLEAPSSPTGSLRSPRQLSNSPISPISPNGEIHLSITIPYEDIEFGRQLGQGGLGIVFQGKWQQTDVAVKQLLINKISERALEEFQSEAIIMAGLRHLNIVSFYGACFEPGHYSMVMELMPKGSLFNLLHTGQPLPWSVRYNISMDITAGLLHLHSKGIIHRDLKSLNVLLDNNMRAKLTDFGLSKVRTETTATTTQINKSVGTLAWMAPELFAIKPKYSTKSDIYGYGMILWELASREIPFREADPITVRQSIIEGETEEIPEEVEKNYPSYAKLIKRCWIFKPEERPTIEEAAEILKENPIVEEVEKMEKTYEQKAQLKTGLEYDDNFASNGPC